MWTRADLIASWKARGIDPDRCFYTGWPLGGAFEVDQMTPIARGGENVIDNLVPCLPVVKQVKNHRTAEEFLRFLDSDERELGIAV